MKKKIMIIDIGKDYGGAEKHIENLIYELKQDYDITLVLNSRGSFIKSSKNLNCNILEIENSIKKLFSNILMLSRYVKNNKIDIINAHGIISGLIASSIKSFSNKNLIITVHSDIKYDFSGKKKKIYTKIEENNLKKSDKIIVVSKDLKNKIQERYNIEATKIEHINNGINVSEIYNYSAKINEIFTFLFVGRLEKVKNVEFLLEGMKIIDSKGYKFKCNIIGDGSQKEMLELKSKDLGLQEMVEFLGHKENIGGYMENSDLMLITSEMEGIPIVIIEGFAYNIPILSSDVGGIKEIIDNGRNGLLYNSNNMDEFIDKIERVLQSNIDLGRITKEAYSDYKNEWNREVMGNKYKKVLSNLK